MTNGVRGRTNGLTNGVRGRTNGLTNGIRGRTNGLTNGLVSLRRGLTNGLTNGSGFTNGLGGPRFRREARIRRWKLYVIPLVSVALLLVPLFSPMESTGRAYPIQIDGVFTEWPAASLAPMSSNAQISRNADIVRFGIVDNVDFLAFAIEVAGTALQGGGPTPGTMDAVRVFLDTDTTEATGYRIDGLGADRMLEVAGAGGSVQVARLWEFDSARDSRDWNGWTRPVSASAAASGARIEAQATWTDLAPSQDPTRVAALVRTQSWDGQTDAADAPLSPTSSTLVLTEEFQAPQLLTGTNALLLRFTAAAVRQSVSFDSISLNVYGTAPSGAATVLRLVDSSGRLLGERNPVARDVRFDFAPQTISPGVPQTFSVAADFGSGAGDTYGVRLSGAQTSPAGAGIVALRTLPGTRFLGYVGVVPTDPRVDGGFAEWISTSPDAAGESTLLGNLDVDLRAHATIRSGGSIYLYADVAGRIFSGTTMPEAPMVVTVPGPGGATDTDRDTVPDTVDPMPYDFDNDGTPDSATIGDVDGDALQDYGFGSGTDTWLNTTIPATFPAPYGGRPVSVYIGPTNRPVVYGEDVLRAFFDLDNATGSGFAIGGIGADRMVEIRGKDGDVTQSAVLSWSGSFPGDWSWTPISPVTVATSTKAIEFSVGFNASAVVVEAGDFWGGADTTAGGAQLSSSPSIQSVWSGVSPPTSFAVASSTVPLVVPWQQVGPEPMATLLDSNSNAVSTQYNHQRKVVRAGDAPGDTACDATNSDGCWYAVFYEQLAEATSNTPPSRKVNVQNGQVALAADANMVDATIASVDTSKAFLIFSTRFDDTEPGESQVSGTFLTAETLRFERVVSTGAPAITIEWYVAEFSSGVSVQRGSASMTTGTVNVGISSVTLTKAFPIISYRKPGTMYSGDDFVKAKLTSSTNLELSSDYNSDGIVEWQVVEYTYASVQSGDISWSTTDATRTASITAVNTAKSWLLFTYNSTEGIIANIGQKMIRGALTNPTTLTFDRDSTGQTMTLSWYLVEFTDTTSVRYSSIELRPTEAQKDVAVFCVDLGKAIVTAGGLYHRAGKTPYSADDNPGVATVTLDFTSSTNLRLTRGTTGSQTAKVAYYIVEFDAETACRIAGTFPADVSTENAAYVQYREVPGLRAKVGSFNLGTGAVSTTAVVEGVGFQPKVVLFWWSGRTESTDSQGAADHFRGVGVAVSATDRRVVFSNSVNGLDFSDARRDHRDDAAIGAHLSSGSIDGLADLQSMDLDGFTLAIDNQFSRNLRVHFLALGGPALTNYVTGSFTEPSVAGDQDVTSVGFQPDAVIFFSIMETSVPPSGGADSSMMIGAAAGSTPLNAVWMGGADDNQNTTQSISYSRAGESIAMPTNALSSNLNGRASVTAWLSNGFRVNWVERGSTRIVHYLALKGGQYLVGDLQTQTDIVTPIVESGFGFTPAGALLLSRAGSQNAADSASATDEFSMAAFSSAADRMAHNTHDRDNVPTSSVGTAIQFNQIYINLGTTHAVDGLADLQSIDSDGFTAIMDDADPSASFVWYLAFGGGSQVDLRYEWSGVPAGVSYTLRIKGYRQDENINVDILTPPSTWNTRFTISATTNTLYTYTLTSAEYNSGAPSIRFTDAGFDAVGSDFWLDLAEVVSNVGWDRIVLMRSSDTSGSVWGSPIVLASGRSGDSPVLYSYDSSEPAIAIDASGYLHVVWVSAASTGDQTTHDRVRYTRTTVAYPTQSELASATYWEAVTVVDDTNPGFMPTVSTDMSNNPHVAWSASKTSGTVFYKNKAAGTWRATVSWGAAYTGLSVDVSPVNNYVSLASLATPAGAWWNSNYQYRQRITVTAGSVAAPNGYSVLVTFNHANLVTAGKSQADGDDIRSLYWTGSAWVELDRTLDTGSSWNSASTRVWFKTQAAISASGSDNNYYLYYGDATAASPPANRANIYLFFDDFESGTLSKWTINNGTWQVATDQVRTGAYSLKYPAEAGSDRHIQANPALSEANVYFDTWWRFSVVAGTDVSQSFRIPAGVHSQYETNLEGTSGWDIAKEINGVWSELNPNAGTPTANTWTRIGSAIYGTGMRVFQDGVQINPASGSFNVGTELASGNIGFKKWAVPTGAGWWADDIVVRRYVDPEPTTALAPEETANEIQYMVCRDLSTSNCDASSEFTRWDGQAGYDVLATSVDSGSYPSLATTFEGNGDLWVAYSKVINGTTRAIQARSLDYPSSGWQTAETVDSLSGTIFAKPSIGIDKDNNVHALYVATSGPTLYYKARTGGTWAASRTTIDASSDNPTVVVRAPNDPVYGTASGALYWKSPETYFHYIPEFEFVAIPILAVLAVGLALRGRIGGKTRESSSALRRSRTSKARGR